MYEKFFYLKENPFNITPDPKFLYMAKKHQEALDILFFGISQRKGFLMLSGEVGTGKTTLCRALLDKLNPKVKSAFILNPLLSDIELLAAINQDFGLRADSSSLKGQLDILNSFLLEKAEKGGNAVVIIDEAQNLIHKALEMIRLLSNIETEKLKLLQIVLVGQPELRKKLGLPELRQLNQRVIVRSHLEPLNFEETKAYIFKRLTIAGGRGNIRFTSGALKLIYEASSGIPRLINIVCDRALTAAFIAGKRVIDEEIEQKAVDELDMDGTLRMDIEIPHTNNKKRGRGQKLGKGYILYPAGAAVIIAVIFAVWWNGQSVVAPVLPITPVIKGASESGPHPEGAAGLPAEHSDGFNQERPASEVNASLKSWPGNDKIAPLPEETGGQGRDMVQPSEEAAVKEAIIFKRLVILLNGVEHIIDNGKTLEVKHGDKLKIVDAIIQGAASKDVSVNFLGFVPKKLVNKGEDRGYVVDIAKDLWVKYSIKKQGLQYPILVKYGDKKIGEVFIKIVSG